MKLTIPQLTPARRMALWHALSFVLRTLNRIVDRKIASGGS